MPDITVQELRNILPYCGKPQVRLIPTIDDRYSILITLKRKFGKSIKDIKYILVTMSDRTGRTWSDIRRAIRFIEDELPVKECIIEIQPRTNKNR